MKDFACGFKKFYDGDVKSISDAFRILKERPYLNKLQSVLHDSEAWAAFKAAQMDAFKAGIDFTLETAKKSVESKEAKKPEEAEKEPFVKSDYISARCAAEETCSDPDELRKWCAENGVRSYGRGFILNKTDYEAWCDHINFQDKRFPASKTLKSE